MAPAAWRGWHGASSFPGTLNGNGAAPERGGWPARSPPPPPSRPRLPTRVRGRAWGGAREGVLGAARLSRVPSEQKVASLLSGPAEGGETGRGWCVCDGDTAHQHERAQLIAFIGGGGSGHPKPC